MTSAASALSGLLSPDRVVDGTERESWAVNGRHPEAVAFPESVAEVRALLGRASERALAVVAAGRGGALYVPGLEAAPDLVVSARKMAAITEYEPADMTLTAEAGITLAELDATTRRNGQWLPLDPPGGGEGTLGALLATASAGPLQAEFGTPRDHVLGLTLVTGDGRVLEVGGRVVKNVAGYDLVRLAVGSGGTLGVIVRATVRLHPVPEADAALVLEGSSVEELAPAVRRLATAPVTVSSLELVEPRPGGEDGALLAARVLGSREAVERAVEVLSGSLETPESEAVDVLGAGEVERLFRALTRPESGGLLLSLALVPGRLDALLEAGRELIRSWGPGAVRPTLALHGTRGRLRISVSKLPSEPGTLEGLAEAIEASRKELRREGGSLRVVSAPPELMARAAPRRADQGVARILSEIKESFDPAGVLPRGEWR